MERLLFALILISLFLFFIKKIDKIKSLNFREIFRNQDFIGYKKKKILLNDSESTLFFELRKQLSQNYYIFPNIRLADIVEAIDGTGFYKRRNKILPKHIDFIICDLLFKPLVAIELNGSSHDKSNRKDDDREKRKILEEAKIPLIVIKIGDNFIDEVLKINTLLKEQI